MSGAVTRHADVSIVAAGTIGLSDDGGRVEDTHLDAAITVRGARPLARAARLALAAALSALQDDPLPTDPDPRAAVVLGTRGASLVPLAEFAQVADSQGPNRVFPMAFPNTVASVHAGYLSTLLRRSGPVLTVCGVGAGLEALLEGARMVDDGVADDVLVGVTDEVLPGPPQGCGEGAVVVRLQRTSMVSVPTHHPRHAGSRVTPPISLVSTATAAVVHDLPLLRHGTVTPVMHHGGLEKVAHLIRSGITEATVVTGLLGVRGAGSALLVPG